MFSLIRVSLDFRKQIVPNMPKLVVSLSQGFYAFISAMTTKILVS